MTKVYSADTDSSISFTVAAILPTVATKSKMYTNVKEIVFQLSFKPSDPFFLLAPRFSSLLSPSFHLLLQLHIQFYNKF